MTIAIDATIVAVFLLGGLVVVGALSAGVTVLFVAAAARRMARETERRARAAPLAPISGPLVPLRPSVRVLASRAPGELARVPFRVKEGASVDVEGGTFQHTTGSAATGVVTATDLGFLDAASSPACPSGGTDDTGGGGQCGGKGDGES